MDAGNIEAEPDFDPVEPNDLFATVYRLMGIDFQRTPISAGNRPIDIVRGGKVRSGLLA